MHKLFSLIIARNYFKYIRIDGDKREKNISIVAVWDFLR